MPWFLGGIKGWSLFPYGIIPLLIWSSVWKGLALWHAAKRNDRWWFIGLLIVNTVGIVEICYLTFVAKIFLKTTSKKRAKK
jgi:hypothetical protein